MITLERWKKISARDQMGHIASEIARANLIKDKNSETFRLILERALALTDLSLNDKKWLDNPLSLLILRNELAEAYLNNNKNLENLYAAF
ncbi:MAG: hypothetical protein AAB772_03260 [Patescibacteria group bacterium]